MMRATSMTPTFGSIECSTKPIDASDVARSSADLSASGAVVGDAGGAGVSPRTSQ
ncbi:hypothetical protein [Burkholderia ubonensis]|uniref:hypothetical protein n=1 Tax=Burkholderia ubonensis TaxID=101571 RepID=UPI0012F73AFB|nr:hypothetical protein [Burkholderia ubonensis]